MEQMTMSYLADLIIVCSGCCLLCALVGVIIAEGINLLYDLFEIRSKKRKEKKNDSDSVSGS